MSPTLYRPAYTGIIPFFNAGRGDLASLMPEHPVPEPGTLLLLGSGLVSLGAGLLGRRWRQ